MKIITYYSNDHYDSEDWDYRCTNDHRGVVVMREDKEAEVGDVIEIVGKAVK